MYKSMLFCLFIVVSSTASNPGDINGRVLDDVGAPIAKAIVELVSQGLKDTTGPDGAYSISLTTDVKLVPLPPAMVRLSITKNILEIKLNRPSPLKLEFFNLKGTLLKKELLQGTKDGVYYFDIVNNCRTANLLFIRASFSSRVVIFPFLSLNNGKYTLESSMVRPSLFTSELAEKKVDTSFDTLKATASGYMTNALPVSFTNWYNRNVYITLKKKYNMLVMSDIPQKVSDITGDQLNSLVHSNTLFTFDLFKNLRASGDNIFFSPYSISEAIAMAYGGAKNETSKQIANAMRFTLPDSIVHAGFDSLNRSLIYSAIQQNAYSLNNANSVWMQESLSIQKSYLDLLASYYKTGFYMANFTKDPDSSGRVINNWMKEMTAGRISDCLPQGAISSLTRLVLVNALYFKSMWNDTFSVANTRDSTFFNLDSTTSTIPFMHARLFDQEYYETDRYQALELMLAGMRTSMVIIIPKPGYFNVVENEFTIDTLDRILSDLSHSTVVLSMPRFSIQTSSYNLKSILSSLGMKDAFESGIADFSGIDGKRDLFIENVYHKGYLDVNERGVEAAATSVIVQSAGIVPEKIVSIDRPFILFIRHRWTKTVLFMGRVIKL
jgi:serpin B